MKNKYIQPQTTLVPLNPKSRLMGGIDMPVYSMYNSDPGYAKRNNFGEMDDEEEEGEEYPKPEQINLWE